MAPTDALFTVRVVTDSAGVLPALWAAVVPLLSVAVGGWITYRATIKTEENKRAREAYIVARSLAAELRASREIITLQTMIASAAGIEAAHDTLRYGQVNRHALPVARAAAAAPGQLAGPVAECLARFMLLLQNMTQQQQIITAMRDAGVLSDAKMDERLQFFAPIANRLVACNEELLKLVDSHHPE